MLPVAVTKYRDKSNLEDKESIVVYNSSFQLIIGGVKVTRTYRVIHSQCRQDSYRGIHRAERTVTEASIEQRGRHRGVQRAERTVTEASREQRG